MLGYRPGGARGGKTRLPTITFTVQNNDAYDAGDVLASTTELANALEVSGGGGILQSLVILDKDDQTAAAMTVYIFKSNVALGTLDAAVSITDANAAELIGVVNIAAGDWTDLIGSKAAFKGNLAIPVSVTTGTSLWVALSTGGTPTQTTGGLVGTFGILTDPY